MTGGYFMHSMGSCYLSQEPRFSQSIILVSCLEQFCGIFLSGGKWILFNAANNLSVSEVLHSLIFICVRKKSSFKFNFGSRHKLAKIFTV